MGRRAPAAAWGFGPVFIGGVAPDDRERIRRAVEPLVPRGAAFDVTRLEAVRRRISELRGVERVDVTPAEASERQREIPIVVVVERR